MNLFHLVAGAWSKNSFPTREPLTETERGDCSVERCSNLCFLRLPLVNPITNLLQVSGRRFVDSIRTWMVERWVSTVTQLTRPSDISRGWRGRHRTTTWTRSRRISLSMKPRPLKSFINVSFMIFDIISLYSMKTWIYANLNLLLLSSSSRLPPYHFPRYSNEISTRIEKACIYRPS